MKSVTFFDIDGVLIKAQSQELFLKFLLNKKKISIWKAMVIYLWFFLYKTGFFKKDVISIRKYAFKVFRGWEISTMKQIINQFYTECLSTYFNHMVIARLKNHQSQGDVVVFLTATIKEIALFLAKKLNVNFVIATELQIVRGQYTGEMNGSIPYGKTKSDFINKFILENDFSLEHSVAYADHLSDLSVLELVKTPIVVNPQPQLNNLATIRGWEILWG